MTWEWCIFLSILTICLTVIFKDFGSDLYLCNRYLKMILKQIDKYRGD